MKCPKCGAELEVDTSIVYTSIPPQYIAKCHNCNYQGYVIANTDIQYQKREDNKNLIFTYLKDNLKIDMRQDLFGNNFLCLILEDEIIDKIEFDLEGND